jgi:ComEC/Rec2-related protein
MKTLDRAPVFFLILFFVPGILAGKATNGWASWGILVPMLGFILLHYREKKQLSFTLERIRSMMIGLVFFAFGAGLIGVNTWNKESPNLEAWNCRESIFAGVITDKVKQNQFGQRTAVKICAVWNKESCTWEKAHGNVQFFLKPDNYQEITLRDSLIFRAWLTTAYSRSQGYLSYLHKKEIFHSAYVKELEIMGRQKRLMDHPAHWQKMLSGKMLELFSDTLAASVAQAMLLGNKSELDKGLKKQFAVAGLSHILAISGLHVGIIFVVLNFLLSPLHFVNHGYRLKSLIILIALVVYMLITGASPAVVRAVIMLGIVLIFRLFYRRFHILNVIAIAAFTQLTFEPEMIFQVGFQLSYAAVLGIVLILPALEKFNTDPGAWVKPLLGWVEVTLAASVATFPLVWYYFGQFPTYFVISNILTSFLVAALVFFGFLTVIFAYVPWINICLAQVTEWLIEILLMIIEGLNQLPFALIESEEIKALPLLMVGFQILFAGSLRFMSFYNGK